MLSLAILDDDIKILEEYERQIPLWFKRNNIDGKLVIATTNYKQFIKEIKDQQANVSILDINLKTEMNGLAIAKYIRKENIKMEIIFCSGMLEYVTYAFDVQPYNFILKSNYSQLEKCIVKLANDISKRESGSKLLEIRFASRIYYIPHSEILFFQRVGTKTMINTINRVIETYESLDSLNGKLSNPKFKQCHRSAIVNVDFIDFIDIKERYIVLKNGMKCELGPKFYDHFKMKNEWSENYAI